mmetsp:Transcript_9780/g.25179  ORF Transcript_9780/g.25179 Transcript_9780/m.25179 type:complete len:210 (-) Transcript_9780:352-981(-)
MGSHVLAQALMSAQACAYTLSLMPGSLQQGCPWSSSTCRAAAASGHLHLLRWARGQGCPWDWRVYLAAASGGHLPVMEWAWCQGCASLPMRALSTSVPTSTRPPQQRLPFLMAAQSHARHSPLIPPPPWTPVQSLACCLRIHIRGASRLVWHSSVAVAAARAGHLHALRWIETKRLPLELGACAEAATLAQHAGVLQWIKAQRNMPALC